MSENYIPVSFDFKKYFRLFKRKKWLLAGIFVIVFLITFAAAMKFGPKQRYSTTALLEFDDRRALSGLSDRGRPENESKIGMLMSRTFLSKVVDRLSLFVYIRNAERYTAIDSIKVDDSYQPGSFRIEKNGNTIRLFYTSPDKSIEDKVVLETTYPQNNTLSYGGVTIFMKRAFWENNDNLEYRVLNEDSAVETLKQSISPNFKNRARTLLEISLSGYDTYFITEVLNTVIDEFVKQNIDFKKYHTREVLNILSEQMRAAKLDLDKAADELKQFREANPMVGVATGALTVVNDISRYEGNRINVQSTKAEFERLLTRFRNATGEAKYPILNEVLAYLGSQGVPTVPALASEFTALTSERTRLKSNYAESHPVIVENTKKLDELENKVLLTANNQLDNWNSQISSYNQQIRSESIKIRNLPAKELAFAELQRKRNVADQVYSDLLVKYNQAKVADAVEVGDIIILDRPVEPQKSGRLAIFIKYFVVAFGVGLAMSFGIVIIGDFLDKTVRTSDELEKLVTIRVVAKIPIVGSEKEIASDVFDNTKRIDPKLVTADYSPTPMGEAYRSLRTQLLFNNDQKKNRSIFVTSLNPGEGKSLNAGNLAITFAQQKIPTLLIDADLRRGVLHNSFACNKKPGLSDFLYSSSDVSEENIRKVIQQTHIPNLYLLSSGMPVPNPSEILGSQRGKDVIKFLNERFGFVIVDTPPIMVTADSIVISQYVDSGLFVVRAGKTNIDEVKNKIGEYKDFKDKLFGLVLNCAELEIKKENYKYSYYNY